MPGCPAAIRVMSRKPPAASRSSVRRSSSLAVATSISVDAASCGTWLTSATSSSWCVGRDRHDLGAEIADRRAARACTRARRCSRVGVSTQVEPTNRSRRRRRRRPAPSRPSGDRRRSGPTRRAARRSTSATTGAFTEPTSVTTAAPASSAATTAAAIAPTGTATITRSAPATASSSVAATSVIAPSCFARASRELVVVEPDDVEAARREREADGAADQPGSDDRDPAGHVRRGGRRGASARLRGRRGGARRAAARRRSASSPGS